MNELNLRAALRADAVALYLSLGFKKVGKIPAAFAHSQHGYVAAYVMYLDLCIRTVSPGGHSANAGLSSP